MATPKIVMERGNVWLNKKTASSWKLDKGKGDRSYLHQITFDNAFPAPPKVFVVFSALDIMNDDDLRISLLVTSTSTTGFEFEVSTWGATHVWSCAVGWIAYDPVSAQVAGARIQSGRIPLKTTTVGWKLDKGSGKRGHVQHVAFEKSYTGAQDPPMLVTGFCMLDVLVDDDDHHLKLTTKDVTTSGFELEVSTWKKTKVWGVSVAYIAFDSALSTSTDARVEIGNEIFTKAGLKALTKGNGERKATSDVSFTNQFTKAPDVLVFLSMQDIMKGHDHRIKTTPRSATEKGFEIEVATWSDSVVFGCHVSWIAFTSGDTSLSGPSSTTAATTSTTTTTSTTSTTSSTPLPNDDSDEEKPSSKGKEKEKAKEKEKEKEKEKTDLSGTKRKDTEDSEDDNVCKVCMDAKINTCLVPCGHLCLCLDCANEVKKQKEPCPICRGLIKQIVQTFS